MKSSDREHYFFIWDTKKKVSCVTFWSLCETAWFEGQCWVCPCMTEHTHQASVLWMPSKLTWAGQQPHNAEFLLPLLCSCTGHWLKDSQSLKPAFKTGACPLSRAVPFSHGRTAFSRTHHDLQWTKFCDVQVKFLSSFCSEFSHLCPL